MSYSSAAPNWFFFGNDETTTAPDPHARLKTIEEKVKDALDGNEELYRLVAYKYLHARGLRIASVDSEIRKELRK